MSPGPLAAIGSVIAASRDRLIGGAAARAYRFGCANVHPGIGESSAAPGTALTHTE